MIANRTFGRILFFSAASVLSIFLAGTTAVAQMQPGGGAQQPSAGQQPTQQTTPQMGEPGMTPTSQASASDQVFVESIMESDAAEVKLGQLAQEKSQSPDVKQFGQKMVENRTRLDQQLKPIADKLDVHAPKEPSKKDRQLIAKLETLSGPDFDQEYIKAAVKDHQKDVKDFKFEAQSAQDPNLQQAAKMDQDVLAQHLQAIEKIAQTHNVDTEAKK